MIQSAVPTVDPKALGAVLDVLAKAETSIGHAVNLAPVIHALVKLANQPYPVGAIDPAVSDEIERKLRDLAEREATIRSKEYRCDGPSKEG